MVGFYLYVFCCSGEARVCEKKVSGLSEAQMNPGLQAWPRQVTGPRHIQSHVPLGAGMGAEVVVVATALCIRPALGFIKILSRQQPCDLDVKIPIV